MHVCEIIITETGVVVFFCFFKGQTPFDVADESVVSLLEELSQRQANVRTYTLLSTVNLSFYTQKEEILSLLYVI